MAGENEIHDDDLDLDLDGDDHGSSGAEGEGTAGAGTPAEKLGEHDDGSFVIELDEDDGKEHKGEHQPKEGEEASDDLEAKRQRRREERRQQKLRRQEEDARIKRELASEREARRQLEERLAVMERRSEGSELAQVDAGIQQLASTYNGLRQKHAEALATGNALEATDTMEKMMQVRSKHDQLVNVKKAFQERKAAPQPLNPSLRDHAEKFMADHKWYSANGNDEDSAMVRAIDNRLAHEGWNPATEGYWDELRSRVKKFLPHKISGGKVLPDSTNGDRSAQTPQGSAAKPKSVVAGSDRSSGASVSSAKGTFKLSPERVNAMKDAGIWDNPDARKEAIKRYREYDLANKRS